MVGARLPLHHIARDILCMPYDPDARPTCPTGTAQA